MDVIIPASSRSWKTVIFLAAVVVLLGSLAVLLYITYGKPVPQTATTTDAQQSRANPVKFSFSSDIPGYQIDAGSVNEGNVMKAVAAFGFGQMQDLPIILNINQNYQMVGPTRVTPDAVQVRFLPIQNQPVPLKVDRSVMLIQTIDDTVSVGFGSAEATADGKDVTVYVYMDTGILTRKGLSVEEMMQRAALEGIFFTFQEPPLQRSLGNSIETFNEKMKGKDSLFQIFRVRTGASFRWQLPQFQLVGQVYAQETQASCRAKSGDCGQETTPTWGTCSGGIYAGTACTGPSQCDGYTCVFNTTCQPDGSIVECYWYATAGGICMQRNNCSGCMIDQLDCGGSAPAPTDAPTATPNPVGPTYTPRPPSPTRAPTNPVISPSRAPTSPPPVTPPTNAAPQCIWAGPSQVTSDGSTNLTVIVYDANGASTLSRVYFGFSNCSNDPGDAYASNFERNLANYFGTYWVMSGWGNVAVINTNGACTGNSGDGNTWGGGGYPSDNYPHTLNIGSPTVTINGSYATLSWPAAFTGFPAGTYHYYAMILDDGGLYQNNTGTASWNLCGGTINVVNPSPSPTPSYTPTPTPTPYQDVRARAILGGPACDNSYANNMAAPTPGGSFDFSLTGYGTKTQSSGVSYVQWDNVANTTPRNVSVVPDSNVYKFVNWCQFRGSTYEGTSGSLLQDQSPSDQTFTFFSMFSPMGPWFQTRGGDVYVHGGITSKLPDTLTDRFFNLNGHQGYAAGTPFDPGVVTHVGGTVDFTIEDPGPDGDVVSTRKWLANETEYPAQDFYDHLYNRLGAPTTASAGTPGALAKSMATACPGGICYYTSDVVTSGTWSIASGEHAIVIVDGALRIATPITVADGGFLAFIVKDGITVASNVGYTTPIAGTANPPYDNGVAGIYVTNGPFTLESSDVQFVGYGSFVANSFTLDRDLDLDNVDYPGALFRFNPRLLITMPLEMQDVPVRWEEVPPTN